MAFLTYRALLTQRSATLTPWQADTLFGSLCWAIVRREGEAGLRLFLDRYAGGEPPLVLSNGFPAGLLPAPLVPRPRQRQLTLVQERAVRDEAKQFKNRTLLPLPAFWRACRGQEVRSDLRTLPTQTRDAIKNTVDRTGNGTVQGGLYSLTEQWPARDSQETGASVVVYARVAENCTDLIEQSFRDVAAIGYGRRASVGYGQIDLYAWEPSQDLAEAVPEANGFVALSNFCPAADDPTAGFFRTMVKYGRLGDERSLPAPFKLPLIQLVAGSCFYTDRPGPYYGRLIRNVHPTHADVVQHGYALAVPIRLPEQRHGEQAL